MPFTREQFLDLFGRYNEVWWPVAAALWFLSLVCVVGVLQSRPRWSRAISSLLVFHWAWSAMYHAIFFTRINPAAWVFSALFLIEAACLLWVGVIRNRLAFGTGAASARAIGLALAVYALAYPGLSLWTGHAWPRAPLFAVPCPTTLFTAGVLLTCGASLRKSTLVVPIIWCGIAGSAAILLDVTPDYALFLAGVVLLVRTVMPSARSPRDPRQAVAAVR